MTYRPKVKICGLTSLDDARAAADMGADFLGFIFAASPRRIEVSEARRFWKDLPPSVPKVGVFRDQKKSDVDEVTRQLPLDYLQLHGSESPDVCRSFGLPVIKVSSPRNTTELRELEAYRGVAECFLVDLPKEEGAGETLPREIAAAAVAMNTPVFLAGGLNPGNVAAFVRDFRPFGVDIARGVESSPGRKDLDLLSRFFEALVEGGERAEGAGAAADRRAAR